MPRYWVNPNPDSNDNPDPTALTVHLEDGCGDVRRYGHANHWERLSEHENINDALDRVPVILERFHGFPCGNCFRNGAP